MEEKPWYNYDFEKQEKTVKEYKETFDQYYKKHIPHLKEIQPEEYSDKKHLLLGESGHEVVVKEIVNMNDPLKFEIEVYSDIKKKEVGFMNKDNKVDFVAFYQAKTNRIYLLSFLHLQLAWVRNFKKWADMYGVQEQEGRSFIQIPCTVVLAQMDIVNHMKIQPM